MHFVDHFFILLMLVIQPVYGAINYRKYLSEVKAGEPAERPLVYTQTIAGEWIACCALFAVWIWQGRSFSDLGFVSSSGTGLLIGLALIAVMCAGLFYGWVQARTMSDEKRAKAREELGDLSYLLPQNRRELKFFAALSVTAGIVEEILYRGFLFWYLLNFMPLWMAAVVSSVIFGVAHSYQGFGGMIKVTLMGLAGAGLYIVSGTLWVPILAHILVDLIQGFSLTEILKRNEQPEPIEASA